MTLALLLVPLLLPAASSSVPAAAAPLAAAQDAELDAKIAAAGRDVAKLLALAASCAAANQAPDAAKVYKKVIEVEPGNEVARKALRHQLYDGKWFESFAELSKYQREEAARMKEKGLARFQDKWVPEADVPFLKMGWVRGEDGAWTDPHEAALAKEVAERQAGGYQFRADDSSWVAPDETEKWAALQWKCGDEWLDMEKANAYHAVVGRWWKLAGEHFVVWTTCAWDVGNLARWHADKTHADLVRLFGVEPRTAPHVVVLNGLEQYNQAAGGQGQTIDELEGFSSLHGAYFADGWYDATATPPRFQGAGVSYWDAKDARASGWGPFWLRWAAAQSWVDAIDRSWNAIGDRIASGPGDPASAAAAFWGEKRIPRWLRYGAASYVERFMKDPAAGEGADPWTLRQFAFGEIKKGGGLRPLSDVFAFRLALEDLPSSSRMYQEAGLVVSYLLDGASGDAALAAKHQAFQAALKSGSAADARSAATALEGALREHEAKIRQFAGL